MAPAGNISDFKKADKKNKLQPWQATCMLRDSPDTGVNREGAPLHIAEVLKP